ERIRGAPRLFLVAARGRFADFESTAAACFSGWRLHRDFEDAVVERRARALADHAFRQRQDPVETAVLAFAVVVAFALFFMLLAALALDGDRIIGDVDLDVILFEPRKIGADDESIAFLERLDTRSEEPLVCRLPPRRPAAADSDVAEDAIEHPVHFF